MYIGTFQGPFPSITVSATTWDPYNYATPPELVQDDLHNPKAWKIWFREFLLEMIPERIRELFVPMGTKRLVQAMCRSGTWRESNWKMKAWKQALYGG